MKTAYIDTPLGLLLAEADDKALHRLTFVSQRIGSRAEAKTAPLKQIEKELKAYFSGKLRVFQTPLFLSGTPFQNRVWEELQKIPCGETRSYSAIAAAIGRPTAFRAVAMANSANPLTLIVPCHRVIYSNGELGGYASGLERKQWLLNHESSPTRKGE